MDTAEDKLMGYGEPRYDQSAKNILSDKSILAHILKSTVSEFKDASIEDIANVYIEGTPEVSQIPVRFYGERQALAVDSMQQAGYY